MVNPLRDRAVKLLRWSEQYTKTDMTYVVSAGGWLFSEQAAAALIALAMATVFGHFASQDTYGNYKYALSLMSILTAFSLTGLSTAITRSVARGNEGALKQGFDLNLKWSGPMIVIGFAGVIYYALIGNIFLAAALTLIAVALPLINGFGFFDSLLIGKQEFRAMALSMSAVAALPAVFVTCTLLLVSKRAIILVFAYLVGSLIANGYAYIQSARKAENRQTDPELGNYGFHLSAMGIIATIADKFDSVIVFSFLGPANLAIYSYAIAIPEVLKGAIKSVIPLSIPRFSARSLSEIRSTIWRRMTLLSLATAGVSLAYVVLAPTIFKWFFPIYRDSVHFSQIYVFSVILVAVTAPILAIMQAKQKTRELYYITNGGSVALVISLPFFIILWGISGAIYAQFFYRAITAILALFFLHRSE